jgi:hypothetical protein
MAKPFDAPAPVSAELAAYAARMRKLQSLFDR